MNTKTHAMFLVFGLLTVAGCASSPRGTLTPSDRPFDLAIDGEGYFIVETGFGGYLFTRRGDFVVDSQRYLATSDGYRLVPLIQLPESTDDLSATLDGQLVARTTTGATVAVGRIKIATFTNPAGLQREENYFMPTAASGDPVPHTPGSGGAGTIKSKMIER